MWYDRDSHRVVLLSFPPVSPQSAMPLSLRSRRLWIIPLIAGGLAAAFVGGVWFEQKRAAARDEWSEARLLSQAIDSVRVNALDSLPSDELIRRAVAGMLRELHDPYAALLRGDGVQRYRGTLQGEVRGLGLSLRGQKDGASVVRVARGSPAHAAGLRAGDRILMVDSVPVRDGWGKQRDSTEDAPSSHVLTVWRAPMGDTSTVTVQRTTWHMSAVAEQGLLADSVGYVRVSTMTARSAAELEDAVESLVSRGAKSLVLDLRGNGGGLFEEGVKAAGLFLPRGAVVSSLAGRGGTEPQPHRAPTSRWPTMPLTVLVDAGTASAAEVTAAALRDYGRALLIGAPTYGKGVVQRVVTLSKELSLRLTTARWLTPNGEALVRREGTGAAARGGIEPDVLLDDAVRRDWSAAPPGWTAASSALVNRLADSLAMHALRESWAISPLAVLEARMRVSLAQMVPREVSDPIARTEWVTVGTRMAVLRVFEVEQADEQMLRYAVRSDAALRAGLDVLTPGVEVSHVVPALLPVTLPSVLGRRVIEVP
ncbi:MAG TPA: PDZ domain-containing protein [Gemmatimonas aurantiaca]|uniref:PDZ domain-containing protein n=2 Tax=Gemmatimonas aurantiaca TaxID=173480 RepID=A0A3D4V5Z6_9BACT|nr:PDZ domain-containing protein [Gemmatimonas aurantiaca]